MAGTSLEGVGRGERTRRGLKSGQFSGGSCQAGHWIAEKGYPRAETASLHGCRSDEGGGVKTSSSPKHALLDPFHRHVWWRGAPGGGLQGSHLTGFIVRGLPQGEGA